MQQITVVRTNQGDLMPGPQFLNQLYLVNIILLRVNWETVIFSALEFYAFTGIGGLSYNVKANSALAANSRFKKGGFTAVIPAGFGVNLLFRPEYNLGLEIGGRYAFSDYLDGYTSQHSSSNDVYYFLNFVVTYKVKTGKNGWPSFR